MLTDGIYFCRYAPPAWLYVEYFLLDNSCIRSVNSIHANKQLRPLFSSTTVADAWCVLVYYSHYLLHSADYIGHVSQMQLRCNIKDDGNDAEDYHIFLPITSTPYFLFQLTALAQLSISLLDISLIAVFPVLIGLRFQTKNSLYTCCPPNKQLFSAEVRRVKRLAAKYKLSLKWMLDFL